MEIKEENKVQPMFDTIMSEQYAEMRNGLLLKDLKKIFKNEKKFNFKKFLKESDANSVAFLIHSDYMKQDGENGLAKKFSRVEISLLQSKKTKTEIFAFYFKEQKYGFKAIVEKLLRLGFTINEEEINKHLG